MLIHVLNKDLIINNSTIGDRYIVLSSNVINVILIIGKFSVDAEDDAPEESVEDEDGEGDEEPDYAGDVHVTQVVVSEEDGETDDD